LKRFYPMSALPPRADIAGRQLDVRFVPKADITKPAGPFAEAVIRSVELIVQPDAQDVVGDLAADISYARELWVACNDHARRCAKAAREPGERRVK
jgi:hypothetical protein